MKKYKQAEIDFISGMNLKDIAIKYGVQPGTVRSWKSRYWNTGTPPKRGDALNPQQEIFAQLVAGKRIPLYRAYQIAYNSVALSTALTAGSRLARSEKVKRRIEQISEAAAIQHDWSLSKTVESLTFLHDEAMADILLNGLKKSNVEALLDAVKELSRILQLDPSVKAQNNLTRARISELKGTEQSISMAGDWKSALIAASKNRKIINLEENSKNGK